MQLRSTNFISQFWSVEFFLLLCLLWYWFSFYYIYIATHTFLIMKSFMENKCGVAYFYTTLSVWHINNVRIDRLLVRWFNFYLQPYSAYMHRHAFMISLHDWIELNHWLISYWPTFLPNTKVTIFTFSNYNYHNRLIFWYFDVLVTLLQLVVGNTDPYAFEIN